MNSTSSSSSSSSSSTQSMTTILNNKKVRKPYTITKSRESWTDEEHDKFLEALQLFDRDWKKIEDFIGSKTVIQIRSHAQKYFLKVQKNGTIAHVPPPRPKRKAAHPYPHKAPKNASAAYSSGVNPLASGYAQWHDTATLLTSSPSGVMQSQEEYDLHEVEADVRSKGESMISNNSLNGTTNSIRTMLSSKLPNQQKQNSTLHGIPDFSEVYSFIGSVFDPESNGHVQKLKEMDPINFETVLLLMRNLTVNLASPDFEPIRNILSSYDMSTKTVGIAAGNVTENQIYDLLS